MPDGIDTAPHVAIYVVALSDQCRIPIRDRQVFGWRGLCPKYKAPFIHATVDVELIHRIASLEAA